MKEGGSEGGREGAVKPNTKGGTPCFVIDTRNKNILF